MKSVPLIFLRRFIIFTIILLLILIYAYTHLISEAIIKQLQFNAYEGDGPKNISMFNRFQVEQNNTDLIRLIQKEYLVPPPNSTQNVSLSEIKKNPLVEYVHKLLGNKTNGYFVECGALTGVFISNTIELEMNFNWTGLLVEADPIYHAELFAKKRKAWISPHCMSPKTYPMTITMRRHNKIGGWSNILEYYFDRDKAQKTQWSEFDVQCFPLYSLVMASLNRTEIDYLSLDVEGAEWSIIQTIPFDILKIKVLTMELNMNLKGDMFLEVSKFLLSRGLVYQTFIKSGHIRDVVFAHHSIALPSN